MIEQFRYENILKYVKIQGCRHNMGVIEEIPPKVNVYVRMTDICNARCKFCEYHTIDTKEIDIDKLKYIVSYLRAASLLGKIQLTGGEPTMSKQFEVVVEELRKTAGEEVFIGVNSNGSNAEKLLNAKDYLSNIAISRHSEDDEENRGIFNTQVMDTVELRNFIKEVGARKIHLSCTLMKDYVGNKERVKNYLDYMQHIGCYDVGFVTLMPCNEYAKEQQIYFEDIGVEDIEGVKKECVWQNEKDGIVNCYCANFTYRMMVSFYARFAKLPGNCVGQLVYDRDRLYTSFGKKIELGW